MKNCPGFGELFRAARGRDMNGDEANRFEHLSQAAKNEMVKRLVDETKGAFTCKDVVGTDGQTYTAFDRVRKRKSGIDLLHDPAADIREG